MSAPRIAQRTNGEFDVSQRVRVSVSVALVTDDDQHDIRPEYSRMPDRVFRPEVLRLAYEQSPTNPEWQCTRAEVYGPVVKKGGDLSVTTSHRDFARAHLGARWDTAPRTPQWVLDMIASHTPVPFTWAD